MISKEIKEKLKLISQQVGRNELLEIEVVNALHKIADEINN